LFRSVDRRIQSGFFVQLLTHEIARDKAISRCLASEVVFTDTAIEGSFMDCQPVFSADINLLRSAHHPNPHSRINIVARS